MDPATGRVIDRHHPQAGSRVTGMILVMPSGRGSSSSSSVLAELVRARTGPAAILMGEADRIVTLGALVAHELYGVDLPVVVLRREDYALLRPGMACSVEGGRVTVDGRVDGPRV